MPTDVECSPTADGCPEDAPVGGPVRGPEAEAELARLAKALAHPARARILTVLLGKASCVAGELAGEVPLAASTVSQHLKVLKEAGLIKGEVDGPRRCYCVDRSVLARLKVLVEAL
ncbi:MAG: ArsR/SmtB family transcription factor [Myxococcota bacterium]